MDVKTIQSAALAVGVDYLVMWKWVAAGFVPSILLDTKRFVTAEGIEVARQLAVARKIKSKKKEGEW